MQTTQVQDVVCGMDLDREQTEGKSEFEGREYYFCSEECRERFENNPAQFVQSVENLTE